MATDKQAFLAALTPYPGPDVVAMQRDDHPRLAASLLTVLERERKIMAESMATVRAKDYAEYLNRLGQIEGLDIAISHAKAQASKLG